MGAQLFGRYLKLTVAPIGGAPGVLIENSASRSGLRVFFEVKKTRSSAANEAVVEIYNLGEQNRTAIDAVEQGVVLEAGFDDLHGIVLSGTVRRGGILHSKESTDLVTRLEVRDGGKGLYGSRFSRSYTAGTSKLSIIRDLVTSLTGVDLGLVAATGLNGTTSQRLALSGLTRVCLDKVCRSWGVEFSVQDGAAQFLDPTQTRGGGALAIKLTPASGLLGSPAKTSTGIRCESLLRADMLPGSYLEIADTRNADGYYKVQSLIHSGDTRAPGLWKTHSIEGVRL